MSATVDVGSVNFRSIETAGTDFRDLGVPADAYGTAVEDALTRSERQAHLLTRGILETGGTDEQRLAEIGSLVTWARDAGSQQRRIVARSARLSGMEQTLVDHIGVMDAGDARAFAADYFESGGSTRAIARWLQTAGAMLDSPEAHLNETERSGPIVASADDGAVVTAGLSLQSIRDAIGTVVDAVVDASGAIGDVVGDVVGWAIDEVADLIDALIEAGRDLGEILSGAVSESLSLLRKFVRAAIEAGKTVGDVMGWAIEQGSDALRHAVRALRSAGRNFQWVLTWAADQTTTAMSRVLETLEALGDSVGDLLRRAVDAALDVIDAVVEGLLALHRTIEDVITAAINHFRRLLDRAVEALLNLDETVGSILSAAWDLGAGAVRAVSAALVTVGQRAMDLVAWAGDQVGRVARTVVDGILEAGRSAIDVLRSAAAATLEHATVVLGALLEAGRSFVRVVGRFLAEDVPILSTVIRAGLDLGRQVGSLVTSVMGRSYRAAARLVEGALGAGATVADVMAAVAGETYWNLRQIVNGVVGAGAPVRELMEWVWEQASGVGDELVRRALLAIRYAGGRLASALDWAIDTSRDAFEAVLRAWESVREPLYSAYEWARDAGKTAWAVVGEVTVIIGNSVSYVLNYLANDFVQGTGRFVRGLLTAGYDVGKLVVRIAAIGLEAAIRSVASILAFGVTLTKLLVETAANPRNVRETLVEAVREAGQTLDDIYAAVEAAGDDVVEAVTLALDDLEESVEEMLEAAFEVGGGLLSTIVAVLVRTVGGFRRLQDEERTDAQSVYGNAIDLDTVRISTESPRNRVIFGVQTFFQKLFDQDESRRPFVTMNLINVDPGEWDDFHRHTLVHELMHVWQGDHVGPVYMAHSMRDQRGSGDAYNYGYFEPGDPDHVSITIPSDHDGNTVSVGSGDAAGHGGEGVLEAADGDLTEFDVEEQAQIVMHYFVRSELLDDSHDEELHDLEPFEPYVDAVTSA